MTNNQPACFLLTLLILAISCSKSGTGGTTPPDTPGGGDSTVLFQYSDSVFYLTGADEDYVVTPTRSLTGKFYGFPEGIDIDEKSGAINISKSETGLKYAISYIPSGTADTLTTFVTLSGINYLDGFYELGTSDSVLLPVYNGNPGVTVPGIGSGSLFDIGSGCNTQGCNVIPEDASINLAQTVRNAVFGKKPANNDRKEFELVYRINDKSGKATNKLKVKLYYFETMATVTQEAYDIISSRKGTIVQPGTALPAIAAQKKAAKPRPPCIFIVGGR